MSDLNEVLNRFENGGRVYLTEGEGAELLGIHKATLQKYRKKGTGPRVFRKRGFHKTQPKTMLYVYSIPDLVLWHQAYIMGTLLRRMRDQVSNLERGIFKSIERYCVTDLECFAGTAGDLRHGGGPLMTLKAHGKEGGG